MDLQVSLTKTATQVQLPEPYGSLTISSQMLAAPEHGLRLNLTAGHLSSFGDGEADTVVVIAVPWSSEPEYVKRGLQGETIPAAQQPYLDALRLVLTRFGVLFDAPKKPKPAKARHRFDKQLVGMAFHVARNGSEATVYWTGRNEMTIKAGAKLTRELHYNKDGSLGYSSKYGEKLRADHQAAIKDFTTIEDVKLRSVNECGLFSYYGDTNGWLELVNDQGQTLDELTQVK